MHYIVFQNKTKSSGTPSDFVLESGEGKHLYTKLKTPAGRNNTS